MAVFNFPIRQTDHAEQAVRAARQIQLRWRSRHPDLVEGLVLMEGSLCIGIGISSGEVSFGEFGQSHRDLTAIGTVVNMAARAQSAADGGQILVTKAVRDRCAKDVVQGDGSVHDLKGFGAPIELYDAAGT